MFTVEDFIKLLKYFKDGTTTDIDGNLLITADDAKAKSTRLFNENLDLPVHSTDDYKRFREVLIRWYASLKTFNDTMKHASDVRSLPDEHLNVLLNSFGFTDQLTEITHQNKIDFFYDLVNLYKIKGSPEAISRVLGYFGFPLVDLIEYWLQYNSSGRLVIRPERVRISTDSGLNINARDLDFDQVTSADPHWMLTKEQVNQLFLTNKIAFPSKTPYFSIRPAMELSGVSTNPTLAVLQRMVQDQYEEFMSGTEPVKDVYINLIAEAISILDLYLGTVYLFNLLYNKTDDSSDLSFLCYDGSMSLTNSQIFDLYESLSSRENIRTREDLEASKIELNNYFTRLRTTNFLTSLGSAGTVLALTNLDFKAAIDEDYNSTGGADLFKELLNYLSDWIRNYISETSSYLTSLVLGFESIDKIKDVINFFKPYRARLILFEHAYSIRNPILDSVIPSDSWEDGIEEQIVDFDTAGGKSSYEEFSTTSITSIPPTDSCRRIDDIYLSSTGLIKCIYYDTTDFTGVSNYLYSSPPIGGHRIENMYLEHVGSGGIRLHVVYDDTPSTITGLRSIVDSTPPVNFYEIQNAYLNDLLQFEVVFESDPIGIEERLYYSRETFDNDSFFDIGASIDFPPYVEAVVLTEEDFDPIITENGAMIQTSNYEDDIITHPVIPDGSMVYTYIDENIEDKFNCHTIDSTAIVDFRYVEDEDSEITEIETDGGWVETDTGMLFDSPAFNDVCEIFITISKVVITSSIVGTHGTIDPLGAINVVVGESKTFTFIPDDHYGVSDILVDGVSQGAIEEYEFINVTEDHTISAEFVYVPAYSFGSKAVYNNDYTAYMRGDLISTSGDNNYFAIAYYDQVPYDGNAIIGIANQSTGAITYGSEFTFDGTGYNYWNEVTRLTDSTFVISYENNTYDGISLLGTITGGTNISFGAPATFEPTLNAGVVSASRLTDTTFVLGYEAGYANVGTVTGTNIGFGTKTRFEEGATLINYLDLTALNSTTVAIAWQRNSDMEGVVKVGTISGSNISFGADYSFLTGGNVMDMVITRLSDTSFILVYSTYDYQGFALIGTVSGTVVTFNTPTMFADYITLEAREYLSVTKISSTKFAVSWQDCSTMQRTGKSIVGTIDGTDITFGSPMQFTDDFSSCMTHSTIALPNGSYLVIFRDASTTYKGTVIMNRYS